jgi:hypothetical protein
LSKEEEIDGTAPRISSSTHRAALFLLKTDTPLSKYSKLEI